jgi:hypothetical protein
MKKRWVDTECWDDPWFQGLSPVNKLFWRYICDRCDCAGVWKVNRSLAEFQIGAEIDWDNLLATFKDRVVALSEEKWLVVKFLKFQYIKLSRNCKPHEKVFDALKEHGLIDMVDTLMEAQRDIIADTLTGRVTDRVYGRVADTLENKIKQNKEEKEEKDLLSLPHTPLVTEGDVFDFVKDDDVTEGICTEEGARGGETCAASGADPPKKGEAAVRHKHGQYGWVRLTGEEYNRLLTEFGNEMLRRYITIVDEYAQTHGNAKKYKDWNLVVRKAIRERWGEKQNESKTSTVTGRKMYDRELRRIEELEREEALKRGNG